MLSNCWMIWETKSLMFTSSMWFLKMAGTGSFIRREVKTEWTMLKVAWKIVPHKVSLKHYKLIFGHQTIQIFIGWQCPSHMQWDYQWFALQSSDILAFIYEVTMWEFTMRAPAVTRNHCFFFFFLFFCVCIIPTTSLNSFWHPRIFATHDGQLIFVNGPVNTWFFFSLQLWRSVEWNCTLKMLMAAGIPRTRKLNSFLLLCLSCTLYWQNFSAICYNKINV